MFGDNTLDIFEKARKPRKARKAPYIHKKAPPHKKSEQLIDPASLGKNHSSPNDTRPKAPDFDTLDRLLEPEPARAEHETRHTPTPGAQTEPPGAKNPPPVATSNNPTTAPGTEMSALPTEILAGRAGASKTAETRRKYAGVEYPIATSRKAFRARAEALLPVIPRLLSGEEELSMYYTLARHQSKNSGHRTMSETERWDISWGQYIAGFYGLERQQYVSTLIQSRYGELLQKSKNTTVVYWSSDMFSTYVLANEILLRMAMADLNITKVEAEEVLQRTVDYGTYIADETPMVDDLEYESEL